GRVLLRQIDEDRARLGDVRAVVELQHRDPPVRVAGPMRVGARLAAEEVDRDRLEREAELAEEDAALEAVPGRLMLVEAHGGDHIRTGGGAVGRERFPRVGSRCRMRYRSPPGSMQSYFSHSLPNPDVAGTIAAVRAERTFFHFDIRPEAIGRR